MAPRVRGKFGRALDRVLAEKGLTQTGLAETLGTSPAYVSAIARGEKKVSPRRIDDLAARLALDAEEVRRLHRAAALDAGFRLDLPGDFED